LYRGGISGFDEWDGSGKELYSSIRVIGAYKMYASFPLSRRLIIGNKFYATVSSALTCAEPASATIRSSVARVNLKLYIYFFNTTEHLCTNMTQK
jgi:hypothetical protein